MYQEHPSFLPPTNPDVPVWRYIDFPKFVDMLERRSLYFARLDLFQDMFEGLQSSPSIESFKRFFASLGKETIQNMSPEVFAVNSVRNNYRVVRGSTFVNCWHMSEHESAAMWSVYSKDGVAIRSTFRRLADSFSEDAEHAVYIGAVRYIDYDKEDNMGNNLFDVTATKRKSFEYERELRAVTARFPIVGESVDVNLAGHPVGLNMPIDLTKLMESVYVAPQRPAWFRELIGRVLRTYGFGGIQVEASALDQRPGLL